MIEPRIEKRSYLEVEWYECKGDECDGPRGLDEARIIVLRIEVSDQDIDLIEVNVDERKYFVPRKVLDAMAKVR